jgi:preprotein translocase SecE subunit
MIAFWALTLLAAYGCFHSGGFITVLDNAMPDGSNPTLAEPFPLFGTLKVSTLLAIALAGISALLIHRVLSRQRVAGALVDTEAEMKKVTWPSWGETWHGTIAVIAMVLVLFVFLTLVDYLLVSGAQYLMKKGS